MMVLSNAERQRRYREKREALARGAMLPEQVRALMLDVLRVASEREGYILGDDDEPCSVEAYVALISEPKLVKRNGTPAEIMAEIVRSLLQDDLSDDDRAIVERARDVLDAINLR